QTCQDVTIRVLNANRAPEIVQVGNREVERDAVLEILVRASDVDLDPLVLRASGPNGFGLPRFATFTDNHDGTGLLRFAPRQHDSGNYEIRLTARDNG